ncbi:MAG: GNAT family N-acetyltransferase [Clostridiales bacterium]|nr:GNAT family N-acetyltransferase [Clostridiales bacterium]
MFSFFPTDDLYTGEIRLSLTAAAEAVPEKGYVPAYRFAICLADGTPVGSCMLRVGAVPSLYWSGHIGYGVDAPHRGHGYAGKACRLLFKQAKKHGMKRLYITCSPDNAPSDRTLRRLCREWEGGGRFIAAEQIPEDHEMYREGKRRVNVYEFLL